MQVSTFVKEAIEEAGLYSNLAHKPDVAAQFCTPQVLEAFEGTLDVSFFNVFNQTCGYYQLKRFAATCDDALKLSFIEDATEYRLIDSGRRRQQRCVGGAGVGEAGGGAPGVGHRVGWAGMGMGRALTVLSPATTLARPPARAQGARHLGGLCRHARLVQARHAAGLGGARR
jgi:hypothetical protein